jgi:hypothetical protein
LEADVSRRPPGCVTVFVAGYKSDFGDAATHQPSNDDHHRERERERVSSEDSTFQVATRS